MAKDRVEIRSMVSKKTREVHINLNDLLLHISESFESTKEIEILKYQLLSYKESVQKRN